MTYISYLYYAYIDMSFVYLCSRWFWSAVWMFVGFICKRSIIRSMERYNWSDEDVCVCYCSCTKSSPNWWLNTKNNISPALPRFFDFNHPLKGSPDEFPPPGQFWWFAAAVISASLWFFKGPKCRQNPVRFATSDLALQCKLIHLIPHYLGNLHWHWRINKNNCVWQAKNQVVEM